MSIVVIGGNSRSVGKTSVVAGLISALPEYNWTAFKITQYGHGICSLNGKQCQCATDDHNWAITEEKDRSGKSDTSRFLLAGASRVWWVRTEQGRLAQAMPTVRQRLAEAQNVIIESNSVLSFLNPDLYLTVLDTGIADFKVSARKFLARADAVLLHQGNGQSEASLNEVAHRPVFKIQPPDYLAPEVIKFVRAAVERPSSRSLARIQANDPLNSPAANRAE